MYTEGGMTTRQIGARVGIPSKTINRYLKKAGVQLRNPGYPVIEQLTNREWLKREYIGARKSTTAIAAEIGCSLRSVALWLERHGIQARSTGSEPGHKRNSTDECRQKMSDAKRGQFIGPDNPNWRGGIQLKHPERNRYPAKMWVKAVKDRDGWKCTECASLDRLHAHHIKRWKDYPELRYEVSNGVTLCHKCHELAHGRGFKFRWPRHADKPKSASAREGMI
jgi:HNH endonuclease